MKVTKSLAFTGFFSCLLMARLSAADEMPTHEHPTIITYLDPAVPAPAKDGSSGNFVASDDANAAEIAQYGYKMIDRIGGMMITEVNHELATREISQAVSIMHLKGMELPKPVPGKPTVTAIKRTSLMLRDPRNAPDAADTEALEKIHNQLMNEQSPDKMLVQKIEKLGQPTEWRVYRPIAASPSCLACHGDPKTFKPGVKEALDLLYPGDKALDYSAHEWRGIIRVSMTAPSAPAMKK